MAMQLSSMTLKILVGTTTGTALSVAQAVQMELCDLVKGVEVSLMDDLDTSVFTQSIEKDALYIICLSSHGSGEVPDNAQALYHSLDSHPQFLGHVRYGLIALGDSGDHADTFCFGARKFDERLQDLGAHRLGDILELDAATDALPETRATAWSRQWLAGVVQPAGSAA